MKIILSRCDKCHIAYLEEQHKTTPVAFISQSGKKSSYDLCDKCRDEILSALAEAENNKPFYIPGD